jgi:hypothetical protein
VDDELQMALRLSELSEEEALALALKESAAGAAAVVGAAGAGGAGLGDDSEEAVLQVPH